MAAAQSNNVAATTGGLASGRRRITTAACPFLQCSMPSLQWPEMHTATLMKKERRTGGCNLFWSVGSLSEKSEGALTGTRGLAFQNLFLFLTHFGRRLMRILHMQWVAAALFGAALLTAAAQAASFSGSSADITDFAGGSEVSTAGTLIEAVKVLNHNVGGVGVSTTINGVLFKGTQPGAVPRRRRVVCRRLVRLSWRRAVTPTAVCGPQVGPTTRWPIRKSFKIDNASTGWRRFRRRQSGARHAVSIASVHARRSIRHFNKTFPLQFEQVKWAGSADNIDNSSPPTQIGFISDITIGGNGVTQANGEIATVYFTIDAGYNGLLVNPWDGGAFSGLQLRQVPEPTTLALCGMVCLACFGGGTARNRVSYFWFM